MNGTLFLIAAAGAAALQMPPVRLRSVPPPIQPDRGVALKLSISAASGKREYRPLEPIVIDAEVENVGGGRLSTMSATSAYSRTLLDVRRPNTGRARTTAFGNSERSKTLTGKTLLMEPGVKFTETFIVNSVYDMTMPGTYEITVGVFVSDYETHETGVAHSKTLTVTVAGEPFDGVHPTRLEPPRPSKP